MNPPEPKHASIEDVLLALESHLIQSRAQRDADFSPLRLSASGSCARKLAYQLHFPDAGEALSSRAISVFDLGHLIHDAERARIKEVAAFHREEEEVTFVVENLAPVGTPMVPQVLERLLEQDGMYHLRVKGHMDGVLELADGPAVVDVKTTSTRSFSEKVKEGPGYEYSAQLNAYMHAVGIHRAWLWLYNKETSHRAVVPVAYNPRIVEEVKARFRRVALSTPKDLPPREHEPKQELSKGRPTGREYLPWQCGYCPFVKPCWSSEGFEMTVEKGKPRWVRSSRAEELEGM